MRLLELIFHERHENEVPENGLASRLFAALARPYRTSYTAPSLMTASAVLYALRGYDVYWSPVRFFEDEDGGAWDPSSVAYRIFREGGGERYSSHAVEVPCVFPDAAILAEHKLREAARRLRARLVVGLAR